MDMWKKILSAVAPTLGSAIGGPFGGMAGKLISEKLLGKPDATDEELGQAISNASPEQLAELKKIDADFKISMKKLNVDLVKIAADDRDSARDRQTESGDKTPQILAYIYTIGLFSVLALLVIYGKQIPVEVKGMLQTSLGVLFAMVYASKDYFFGSSAGSARKTEIIGK